jgi:site-specific DNA recombinase
VSRQAVGIIRVSRVKGREGDSFASPVEQRERIEAACERDGLELLEVHEELDVSGGTPLAERTGLRSAIEAVEDGSAQVIVAAYFDRLVRSLKVQGELIERVERAGGQVLAVDVGRVTNGSAGQWLSGAMLGAVAEYQRRTTAERSGDAQRRAVERGVCPFPCVPPGYRRGADGVLEVNQREARVVVEAFKLRADGSSVKSVRAYLGKHGIKRSYSGVVTFLESRVVLGELHFGELHNLTAHPAIVEPDLWARVQRVKVPRGRQPSSDRLLARLGVLRCGTCGARMSVGSSKGGTYPLYRCANVDCRQGVAIGAELLERAVVEHVQSALSDVEGRASARSNVQSAEKALEKAQSALDGAIRTLADFSDEPAARERLSELRETRDSAQAKLDKLGPAPAEKVLNAARDWDLLEPDGRRSIVAAVIERVSIAPGKGPQRIEIQDVAA